MKADVFSYFVKRTKKWLVDLYQNFSHLTLHFYRMRRGVVKVKTCTGNILSKVWLIIAEVISLLTWLYFKIVSSLLIVSNYHDTLNTQDRFDVLFMLQIHVKACYFAWLNVFTIHGGNLDLTIKLAMHNTSTPV